jgi:spermidine/putrescine ABC transporter ATP-binding subunit
LTRGSPDGRVQPGHDGQVQVKATADPLVLERLEKRFGDHRAVAGIDLAVAPGEFVTLLGPSGCGKTTTLNMIAGFLEPSAGSILMNGEPVEGLPPFRRNVGLVFQDYALFPNMTVAENVAFGLRMRKVDRAEIGRRVAAMVDLVKLSGMENRRPQSLSGGQRQRVALARALVIQPQILLLDEPLSNLDLKLREEMRSEISQLQRRLRIPTVFVTHDQDEALTMSDRIVVMNNGSIEQAGSPADIYERPRSRFVAEFVGMINLLNGSVIGQAGGDGLVQVETPVGTLAATADAPLSGAVSVVFRPERVRFAPAAPGEAPNSFRARVTATVYLGSRRSVRVVTETGIEIMIDRPNDGADGEPIPGTEITVSIRPEDCRVLAN